MKFDVDETLLVVVVEVLRKIEGKYVLVIKRKKPTVVQEREKVVAVNGLEGLRELLGDVPVEIRIELLPRPVLDVHPETYV